MWSRRDHYKLEGRRQLHGRTSRPWYDLPRAHIWYAYMIDPIVDASGGTFQVRPHKDFSAVKGRDRILSLRLLSELPADVTRDTRSPGSEGTSEPRNAYEFMRRRQEVGGDPTMQRWNASIRLANHASLEATPLCVSCTSRLNLIVTYIIPLVRLHWCFARSSRAYPSGRRSR